MGDGGGLRADLVLEYPFTRTTGPVIGAFLTGLRVWKPDGELGPTSESILHWEPTGEPDVPFERAGNRAWRAGGPDGRDGRQERGDA